MGWMLRGMGLGLGPRGVGTSVGPRAHCTQGSIAGHLHHQLKFGGMRSTDPLVGGGGGTLGIWNGKWGAEKI